jgi:hypothetical protein
MVLASSQATACFIRCHRGGVMATRTDVRLSGPIFSCLFDGENSLGLLVPHTNGPRDVPRCRALSLLQKPLHYRGDLAEIATGFN